MSEAEREIKRKRERLRQKERERETDCLIIDIKLQCTLHKTTTAVNAFQSNGWYL